VQRRNESFLQGDLGYHPLVVTLANMGEVLRLVNRPGNRPSHEGAAGQIDQVIPLCRRAGFQTILLRGDTDFTQSTHLDRWHELGYVKFVFGMDVTAGLHVKADDLPETAWKTLHRPRPYETRTKHRRRPARVKQQVVDEKGYKDIRLAFEEVAEMEYRPVACRNAYEILELCGPVWFAELPPSECHRAVEMPPWPGEIRQPGL
jgi:hypothetical protein